MPSAALDDRAIDIAEAALLLASLDRPGVPLGPYRGHLAELADQARTSTARSHSVDMQVATLTRLLVEHHGYRGDEQTYDDLRNANLMDVIDRKVGLPVALGILWLHAGRAYGGDIDGLAFPSHFLIRLAARGQRVIIDVFHGGTTAERIRPAADAETDARAPTRRSSPSTTRRSATATC